MILVYALIGALCSLESHVAYAAENVEPAIHVWHSFDGSNVSLKYFMHGVWMIEKPLKVLLYCAVYALFL